MAEQQNIPWWQAGFQNLGVNQPLGGFSFDLSAPAPEPVLATNLFDFTKSSGKAMQPTISGAPQNQAQQAKQGKSSLQEAFDSVQSLMKGKGESGLDLSKYNRVERDSAGNIIGLSGRMAVGPGGQSLGKMAPDVGTLASDYKESVAGSPYTPRLDAFKAAQNSPSQQESAQSVANRQAFVQSAKDQTAAKSQNEASVTEDTSGMKEITGEVIGSLNKSSIGSENRAQESKKNAMNAVRSGDVKKAYKEAGNAAASYSEAKSSSDLANKISQSFMTPYGAITTSNKKLGVGGTERIASSDAVNSLNKDKNKSS